MWLSCWWWRSQGAKHASDLTDVDNVQKRTLCLCNTPVRDGARRFRARDPGFARRPWQLNIPLPLLAAPPLPFPSFASPPFPSSHSLPHPSFLPCHFLFVVNVISDVLASSMMMCSLTFSGWPLLDVSSLLILSHTKCIMFLVTLHYVSAHCVHTLSLWSIGLDLNVMCCFLYSGLGIVYFLLYAFPPFRSFRFTTCPYSRRIVFSHLLLRCRSFVFALLLP